MLREKPSAATAQDYPLALRRKLGTQAGERQRRDQLARQTAVYRRGVRAGQRRLEAGAGRRMEGILWSSARWGVARGRIRGHPAGQIPTQQMNWSGGLRYGSLRSPPRSPPDQSVTHQVRTSVTHQVRTSVTHQVRTSVTHQVRTS